MNRNKAYRKKLHGDFEDYMKATEIREGQPTFNGKSLDVIPLNHVKNVERYTAPKGTAYAKNSSPKGTRINKTWDRIRIRIAVLGMAGIAGISVRSYANLKEEPYKEVTNKSAQENGNESNDKVEYNTFDYYIQRLQDEELTEEELRAMPKEIGFAMEYELKERFSKLLGYPEDEIEFYSKRTAYLNGDSTEGVDVNHRIIDREGRVLATYESKYQEEEWLPFTKRKRTIDENTAGYIVNMKMMQSLGEGEDIDLKDIKSKCIHAAKIASKYQKLKLNRDAYGNITATKEKVLDVQKDER